MWLSAANILSLRGAPAFGGVVGVGLVTAGVGKGGVATVHMAPGMLVVVVYALCSESAVLNSCTWCVAAGIPTRCAHQVCVS